MRDNGEAAHATGGDVPALTLKVMLCYAVANIGLFAIDMIFDSYLCMLYIDHRFITYPLMFGAACFIGRTVDATANPVVGYWSDRSYGPKGRRTPYILRGAIPAAVFFILLFYPISRNNNFNIAYVTICASGTLFFFTYMCAPYLALIPDLARTNDDRVKMTTYWTIAGILGIILASIVAGQIIDSLIAHFKAVGRPGMIPYSYSYMALGVGVFCLITFLFTGLTIKEKPFPKEKRVQLSFWESFLPSIKNRLFVIYAISICSFWVGFKVVQTSVNFICKYVFGKSEAYGSIVCFGGMIAIFLAGTPFVFFLQKKFGKKALFAYSLLAIAIISVAQGFIDVVPKSIGLYYYTGLIFAFGVPFAALQVLAPAVIGDIVDIDAKEMGVRREAMFYGVEGFVSKLARGVGWPVVTGLFQIFGKPSPVNHTAMIVAGPVCGVFAFIGFLAFLRYPIKE